MNQKSDINSLIAELDSFFGKKSPPKTKLEHITPQKPTVEYWIPVAVVLTCHSWQCSCGASEEGTPSIFVREKKGSSVRLRRIGKDNYSLLPHVLERLDPEQVDVCPYCFQESYEGSKQLRFSFEEEPAVFIRPKKKTQEERHDELLEKLAQMQSLEPGPSTDSAQMESYETSEEPYETPDPFLIDFINSCSDTKKLSDETTEQAFDLARRGLTNLL
jgi:hypothetical protein